MVTNRFPFKGEPPWEDDPPYSLLLPAAFYFKVSFPAHIDSDTSFQDVTGIGSELETEPVVEGGENRFVHQLPKGIKHPKLVLKRGIANLDSPLVKWCKSVLEEFTIPIKPQEIQVSLLNEKMDPIRAWSFINAYPVNWAIEDFNSTKNEVAIEKIDFNYNYSIRVT